MAETLVLIPGLANTGRLYEPQIAVLGASRGILVADHSRDDSIRGIAARLLADAPERFALAGLSMGGYVAMEVMRQAPERVTRLALLDTSSRPDADEAREDPRRMIALAEAGRLKDVAARLWPRLVAPQRHLDEDLKAVVTGMVLETGPEAYIRQQRAIMGRPDSRPSLGAVRVPILILVGEADQITPPGIAEEMAGTIQGASLVTVPGSGHLSALEQPEKVTRALQTWLGHPAS